MKRKSDDIKEQEFENIIKLMKDLPKVSAPDNFEYNLMTRIQNKNFGEPEKPKFNKWLYVFAPASAVVVTTFLVFFFFIENIKNYDDPFTFEPPVKLSQSVHKSDTLEIKEIIVNNNTIKAGITEQGREESVKQKSYKVVVQSNDIVKKADNIFPIDASKSVDLDKALSGESPVKSRNSRVRLVNQGENYYSFDEFIVKQDKDSSIKSLRARMDSLRKNRK